MSKLCQVMVLQSNIESHLEPGIMKARATDEDAAIGVGAACRGDPRNVGQSIELASDSHSRVKIP